MQYLEAIDSNSTEVCLFQCPYLPVEDSLFIAIPKEQLEFKPLLPEELKEMKGETK